MLGPLEIRVIPFSVCMVKSIRLLSMNCRCLHGTKYTFRSKCYVAGIKMWWSILYFLLIKPPHLVKQPVYTRVLHRSKLYHFQSSNTWSKVFLKVVQKMQFIMFSRFRNSYAVSLLRIDLNNNKNKKQKIRT